MRGSLQSFADKIMLGRDETIIKAISLRIANGMPDQPDIEKDFHKISFQQATRSTKDLRRCRDRRSARR